MVSCNTTDPPPDNRTLTLTFEDASCTEVWIQLSTENFQLPAELNLIRTNSDGNSVSQIYFLTTRDSLLYIDSLLPNNTYKLKASSILNSISSNEINIITMDTTSHNFTWQTFTFGEHSSSVIYDVAIIDENNIWAVGEIYMNDSLGQPDPQAYNAVHWDGNEWKLLRILFYTICGQQSRTPYPASSIFAFSENEIWIAMRGDQIAKIENGVHTQTMCLPWSFTINKIWGTSSNDLFVVGNQGNIAHYQNGQWNRIETETTTNINDVWGYYDQVKNIRSVMAVASNILQSGEYRLISISDNIAKDTLNWPYNHWLKGIWFKNEYSPVYVCGSGIRVYRGGAWEELNLPNYFTESIRGNDVNDIMTVGHYGIIMHFNGVNWNVFNDFFPADYIFSSVALKKNTVIIVGNTTSGGVAGQAIIVVGKR